MSVGSPFDVLPIGGVGVDCCPTSTGSIVEKFLGGGPTNVAVAVARLGERAAVITRTRPDPVGEYVQVAPRDFGVDDLYVSSADGLQTPATSCDSFLPGCSPICFYRTPQAPDLEIYPEELDLETFTDSKDHDVSAAVKTAAGLL